MWANDRAVARTADIAALTRRLRLAMSRTTRNATPTFRKLEICPTSSILTVLGVTMTQTRPSANRSAIGGILLIGDLVSGRLGGSTTQATYERARRRDQRVSV